MNTVKAFLTDPVRRTVLTGIVIGALIAFYGLYLSREHIEFVGHFIKLKDAEAEWLFVFIDVVAGYGKLLMSNRLVAKTRRIGKWFFIAGAAMSLICNVMAGVIQSNYGEAGFGAGIVGLIGALEYSVANTRGKAARTAKVADAPAPAAAPVPAAPKRAAKCAAGCTCGKHNRTRARKVPAAAPISPAPMGAGPAGPSVAELEEMVNTPAYI